MPPLFGIGGYSFTHIYPYCKSLVSTQLLKLLLNKLFEIYAQS